MRYVEIPKGLKEKSLCTNLHMSIVMLLYNGRSCTNLYMSIDKLLYNVSALIFSALMHEDQLSQLESTRIDACDEQTSVCRWNLCKSAPPLMYDSSYVQI